MHCLITFTFMGFANGLDCSPLIALHVDPANSRSQSSFGSATAYPDTAGFSPQPQCPVHFSSVHLCLLAAAGWMQTIQSSSQVPLALLMYFSMQNPNYETWCTVFSPDVLVVPADQRPWRERGAPWSSVDRHISHWPHLVIRLASSLDV